jgi:hypothetical protein
MITKQFQTQRNWQSMLAQDLRTHTELDEGQTHLTDLDINYNIPTSWKAAMLVPSECSDAIQIARMKWGL